jgi:hypothetical protein
MKMKNQYLLIGVIISPLVFAQAGSNLVEPDKIYKMIDDHSLSLLTLEQEKEKLKELDEIVAMHKSISDAGYTINDKGDIVENDSKNSEPVLKNPSNPAIPYNGGFPQIPDPFTQGNPTADFNIPNIEDEESLDEVDKTKPRLISVFKDKASITLAGQSFVKKAGQTFEGYKVKSVSVDGVVLNDSSVEGSSDFTLTVEF